MILILLICFILASITPPVAIAVALLAWCSSHIFLTICLVLFFA